MKEQMLEAMKRKRAMIQQHEEDAQGEHAASQSSQSDDQELAPSRGSEKDTLMSKAGKEPGNAESSRDEDNQTALGEQGGFDHVDHASAPENSKVLFHDPKKDTHDPADLNRNRNMAGDGSNSKYDKMGVDEHKDVRHQSSKLAGENAVKNEGLKKSVLGDVKSKVNLKSPMASQGEEAGMDAEDSLRDNSQQAGFKAPFSKVNRSGSKSQDWDVDKEGANNKGGLYAEEGNEDGDEEGSEMKPKMTGLKGARAKLDGFLSKMKKS